MKNKKVIVISGFSRGGTNLLWNILQSHPKICSVRYETGTIFRKRRHKFSRVISLFEKTVLIEKPLFQKILDYQFYRYKLSNFKHPENKYKFENVNYTKQEVKNSALCFKKYKYGYQVRRDSTTNVSGSIFYSFNQKRVCCS